MSLGVVVGRFQVPHLHEGHIFLINEVLARHSEVLVVIGETIVVDEANPLDYNARAAMIKHYFPDVGTMKLDDHPSDRQWSVNLDMAVLSYEWDHVEGEGAPILYGSRDSFITYYHGRFETQIIQTPATTSGTTLRKIYGIRSLPSMDFRSGAIWATQNQFPRTVCTVDAAILNEGEDGTRLLLARKESDSPGMWRFVGGFSDPDSPSFEDDAVREVAEETGLLVSRPHYLGSTQIEDWRYRGSLSGIKTMFFTVWADSSDAVAADDICEVKWFALDRMDELMILPNHRPLWKMLELHMKEHLHINRVPHRTGQPG